ncbi:autotransporter domain-containing protein [Bradyrhizobium sp.]|uniref:autotransporter outer membrane beta-barrel domain-containing protein n=1 Tax=Bradyrhizobium sp. TaxID=376 RepID=UPI001DEBEB55|nr:autotransporter domain-containing protein [Bradyrhizobium sp.]MBI5317999.1 autotransporter domain-containing protein [Bradyrhizobium sp.]
MPPHTLKVLTATLLGSVFGTVLVSPALAQCVTVGTDVTCTNAGALANNTILQASTANGTATTTNSGSIGNNSIVGAITGPGNAIVTNSGSIGNQSIVSAITTNGNASLTNSGSIGTQSIVQAIASPTGNASLTNSGSIGGSAIIQAIAIAGTAEITNSGSIGSTSNILASATQGNASLTNSGSIGGNGSSVQANSVTGNASLVNSGSIGGNSTVAANSIGGTGSASLTNSGSIGGGSNVTANSVNGTASLINSGSIGGGSTVLASSATGNANLTNSGSIGSNSNITANSATGNVSFTNSGSIGNNTSVLANSATGSVSFTNSGSIGNTNIVQANSATGNVSFTNSGSIGSSTVLVNSAAGNVNLTNSGSIGPGANVQVNSANGTATITNAGFIGGSVNVNSASAGATLTNIAGSRISGSISITGPNNKTLEFIGGNYLYTLASLSGVNINTHGAPFVVSGNTVAVLDPTVLALEDRSVMNFTAGVSSMLQDRFGGMVIPGGAGRATPLAFAPSLAPDTAARLDAAHDAFAGLSSLSMSYASDDSRLRNANAAYTKAPVAAVPVYDITVWTSGFGGERRQSGYEPVQAARDTAYGGTIGVDRQFTPELRFGLFAGGGASKLRAAFDVQSVDSEYGFGGGYGRWDRRDYYVDFALFAGGLNSKSTRQVANNLVANGLEVATASYNGWFVSPDVTFGYRMYNALGTVTPKARVRYVGGTLDGYTETGSAQGLVIGSRHFSDIEERLGIEFATITALGAGTVRGSVDFSAVGLQRLGDNNVNAVLLAQNLAFTTPGRREAYGGVINAGLDWRPKSNVSFFLSGEAMATNDAAYSVAGKGGVRVGF